MKLSKLFKDDSPGGSKLKKMFPERWTIKNPPPGISYKPQQTAPSGPDVIPNPLDWQNISYSYNPTDIWQYTTQYLTGINTIIQFKVEYTSVPANIFTLYFKTDAFPPTYSTALNPLSQGFSPLLNNDTFSSVNNRYISFGLDITGSWDGISTINATVTVRNVSDSNTILDTFVITAKELN